MKPFIHDIFRSSRSLYLCKLLTISLLFIAFATVSYAQDTTATKKTKGETLRQKLEKHQCGHSTHQVGPSTVSPSRFLPTTLFALSTSASMTRSTQTRSPASRSVPLSQIRAELRRLSLYILSMGANGTLSSSKATATVGVAVFLLMNSLLGSR